MNFSSILIEDTEDKDTNIICYKDGINYLYSSKNLNLSDYTYLVNYSGSIICTDWIIQLINNFNDKELCIKCKNGFPKVFTIKDNKIKYSKKIKNGLKKNNNITLTKEQFIGGKKILKFLIDKTRSTFGFYGYAGSGKTTTIVEIISYLITNNYIKSIAFTAPTNKAVNVMKSKFRPNLKSIYQKIIDQKLENDFDLDQALLKLGANNIKIDFITIHKLLKFKNEYDSSGSMVFVKSKNKSLIMQYDIVVIDECSMISLDIIDMIYSDIKLKENSNLRKLPKIIFTGDPAQLPPVSEPTSFVFIKSESELPIVEYKKYIDRSDLSYQTSDMDEIIEQKRKRLAISISNMESITLKNVVRSKIDTVVEICREVRRWVNSEVILPDLNKFIDSIITMV